MACGVTTEGVVMKLPTGDDYAVELRKLAEVGAALCAYMPGAGNPDEWPASMCDCKFAGDLYHAPRPGSEVTGCAEVRRAYLVLQLKMCP